MKNSPNKMPSEKLTSLDIQELDIRAQVDRICKSPELEKSTRLKEVLNFIIEEFLAGRADRIKGFSIGKAIFSVDKSFDSETNSVVRVEIGRLRRRLTEYYLTSGRDDPIVIDIPKGSYAPRFEVNPQSVNGGKPSLPNYSLKLPSKSRLLAVGAFGAAVFLVLTWWYYSTQEQSVVRELNRDKTQVITEDSEAKIMFQQAFVLLMPPGDKTRLTTSKELFKRVIEIDSSFGGGYAGQSIANSFQIIFLDSEDVPANLRTAMSLAENAVETDPEYGLGYAALALAQCLNADTDSALANIRRVVAIQPHNGNDNAVAAIALIICGVPTKAIDLLSEAIRLNPNEQRTPYLNILGVAQYVTGDYSGAAESIKKNLGRKGPTGPHMDVTLAATYAQMGKDFEARAIIEKLQRTSPHFSAASWLGNFIKSEEELRETISKLQSLGY